VRRRTDSAAQSSPLPWQLLGVHSSGLDVVTTEPPLASASLHCAWFADLLLPLTAGD
jgi:hypothetical protein